MIYRIGDGGGGRRRRRAAAAAAGGTSTSTSYLSAYPGTILVDPTTQALVTHRKGRRQVADASVGRVQFPPKSLPSGTILHNYYYCWDSCKQQNTPTIHSVLQSTSVLLVHLCQSAI